MTLACAASLLVTPLVIWLARRLDMVDRPDLHRKLHNRVVPLGGGVAVLLAGAVSWAVFLVVPEAGRLVGRPDRSFLAGLAGAAVVICGLGLMDDRVGLKGRQKLAGQMVAVGILIMSGLVVRRVAILGWDLELGPLAVPLTAFWLLGAINAMNLLDGADGLAAGAGVVLSGALAGVAIVRGHGAAAAVALALAGSLAGFSCYNLPPARIFLGDAGSMLIGLVVGAVALGGSLRGPATVALATPAAILAIPILDVTMAILRRKLTGRSLYVADRGHLHHRLQALGLRGGQTVAVMGGLCAVVAGGGLAGACLDNDLVALASAAIVTGGLVATRVFGHSECLLLVRCLKNLAASFFQSCREPRVAPSRQLCTHLEGTRPWKTAWKTLVRFAEQADLSMVQLNVSFPALHEEYHARWERTESCQPDRLWQVEIPLVVCGRPVGHLKMAGAVNGGSGWSQMTRLIPGLRAFEGELVGLVGEIGSVPGWHVRQGAEEVLAPPRDGAFRWQRPVPATGPRGGAASPDGRSFGA